MGSGRAFGFAHRARVGLVVLALLLTGCVGSAEELVPWRDGARNGATGEPTDAVAWSPGNWWSYNATFTKTDRTYPIALVVYEETPNGYVIGSNLTAGFFGLPFNGNVTKPNFNPVIAGEEWQLFRFPLQHGKSWEYEFMGYPVEATVEETRVEAPDLPTHRGYKVKATSYGQTVVEYTYSPVTKWFTHLVLHDPGKDQVVVRVELTGFGGSYESAYYVNVPVWTFDAEYPADLPGEPEAFEVQDGFLRLSTTVALRGQAGDFRSVLRDPGGHAVMENQVRVQGVVVDRQTFEPVEGTWRLDHRGLGKGSLHLEVTGLKAARVSSGPEDVKPPQAVDERVDVAALFAAAAEAEPAAADADDATPLSDLL